MATSFPGFDSPAVGFEQPFDMLEACHDRVRRSLSLLERLMAHIDASGHDEKSRSAATDVLRYFELAAPLHHEDEELHVFPLLLARGDAAIAATVQALLEDHRRMNRLWATLRTPLSRWTRAETSGGAVDEKVRRIFGEFGALYASHLEREEGLVFPAAKVLAGADDLAGMGAEMQRRRAAADTLTVTGG